MRSAALLACLAVGPALAADAAAQDHGIQTFVGEVFGSSTQFNPQFGANVCVLDDVNGDNTPEFLATNVWNEALLHDGRTGAQLWRYTTLGLTPRAFRAEDYDGDGVREFGLIDDRNGLAAMIQLWSTAYLGGFNLIVLPSAELHVVAAELESDRDGDGFRELFVASTRSSPDELHVRYYSPIDGSIVQEFSFTMPQNGWSISAAVLDDIDQDGVRDFVIGDANEDRLGWLQAGSARVYSGATGAPLSVVHGSDRLDRLGGRVASAPDLDGDGIGDLLALSQDHDYLLAWSPARDVELYRQPTGTYMFQRYPWSVAWAEDRDGDGVRDFFEGDSLRSGVDGRVLRSLRPSSVTYTPYGYARSHAMTRDLDGDGYMELVSGASSHTPPFDHVVLVRSVHPGIETSDAVLHAQSPQPVTLELRFPAEVVGQSYFVLASTAPVGTTTIAGLELPLGDSPLLQRMVQRPPLGVLPGGAGVVPASGSATAVLQAGAPLALQALGMTIRFAVVTGQSGAGTWSSFAVPVTVLP